MRRYCVLCALGFCNQMLPDLQCTLKRRTLQLTTIIQLLGVSHVLGFMQRKKSSTRSSPIGDWSKGSTVGWYFKIVQGSNKISYTSSRLLLISGFLGVVTRNLLGGSFCLARSFLHSSTNHRVNLIPAALSLFGDFLVLPRFVCNLT